MLRVLSKKKRPVIKIDLSIDLYYHYDEKGFHMFSNMPFLNNNVQPQSDVMTYNAELYDYKQAQNIVVTDFLTSFFGNPSKTTN